MSNAWSGVDCAEEFGTAEESYEEELGLMSASVTLRCRYSERHALAADICGNRRPWPKGAFGITPHAAQASIRMAQNAGTANLFTGLITSLEALVTVHYSTRNEDVITESIEPVAMFVPLSARRFLWESGQVVTEDEHPGALVNMINFVRSEMYVQPPLPQSLLDLMGTCNNAPITSSLLQGFVFPEETLLYQPPVITRKISSVGSQQYDIVKKWTYQPQGWNKYLRSSTGNYERMLIARTGDPWNNYPPQDHSVLRA